MFVRFITLCFLVSALSLRAGDTSLVFHHKTFEVNVKVLYPETTPRGTILLLHGYNLPYMQWCEKTDLCSKALARGYTLIIPDFGKSTYQEKFYPQTADAFRVYPTRKWIRDTVIAQLQQRLRLLLPGQQNYVLGLSTGARGAALLAIDLPQVFKASACLSGDFDQSKLPNEKIYTLYYGKFSQYAHIWKTDDNLHAMIQRWKTPVYLAHGALDKVCPPGQTTAFYRLLQQKCPQVIAEYHLVKNQQHDYTFWGSQTKPVLDFFDRMK